MAQSRKPKNISPSKKAPSDPAAARSQGVNELAAAFPHNRAKPSEIGEDARKPAVGQAQAPRSTDVTASTLSEAGGTPKTGTAATPGVNATIDTLDRVRTDASGRVLTTNLGAPIADNQNSLKAGLRGPTLMEDFVLREKITHFDHERIPERIVHARGSAAHGYFECYAPLPKLTRAAFLSAMGKRTPVFVRFSTVAGERGSVDTARDVRGFATKFYTEEGNFDLVGNNIPVFFIQDAMKFPDLVHSVKPEPHHGMPQAGSAHDTFWDFVSLMPESTHMLMWAMSDRALPRSLSMMQGFGVHTFRLVNAQGETVFVKFHWNPAAGTHSLDWDESVKIAGADADFHRRDLWESIEAGNYPTYELGFQVFTESQAEKFSFDVLDPTKLVPEELVPVQPVGRMVLDRNPDNFFAETEQVAFGVQNIVPGIDFSNDPLLAGRIHSYFDTQISRLGGPNFHEIPINASIAQVHNNQRDGMHRQAIARGRVAYEPNSLGGGCPFQAGVKGFMTHMTPDSIEPTKLRGKPEKFADHYTQATLFWNSQSPIEKAHIVRGFRFELTKVQVPAIRERTLSMLANVADELVNAVAEGLGMAVPKPMPLVVKAARPEVTQSPTLSLFARPGPGGVRGRVIAILVADGVAAKPVAKAKRALEEGGATVKILAARLGVVQGADGETLEVGATFETMASVLCDGVIVPDGDAGLDELGSLGHVHEFLKDQYRHCKPILAIGGASALLKRAGLPAIDKSDWALVANLTGFIDAMGKHRNWDRQIDPPPV